MDPHLFNADPDPAFFLIADPDPSLLGSGSRVLNADLDPGFFNADPDPVPGTKLMRIHADPDPVPAIKINADPCGSGSRSGYKTQLF